MTTPNTSTFIASKFVSRWRYDKVFADRDALSEQLMEAIKALSNYVERCNSAEGMLKKLRFQREENGIWTNSEL
jgi:type I site-specific restriction-modification system R (restriction) subunit